MEKVGALYNACTVVCTVGEACHLTTMKHTFVILMQCGGEAPTFKYAGIKTLFVQCTDAHNIKLHQIALTSNINAHYPHSCRIHLDISMCSETRVCIETHTELDSIHADTQLPDVIIFFRTSAREHVHPAM